MRLAASSKSSAASSMSPKKADSVAALSVLRYSLTPSEIPIAATSMVAMLASRVSADASTVDRDRVAVGIVAWFIVNTPEIMAIRPGLESQGQAARLGNPWEAPGLRFPALGSVLVEASERGISVNSVSAFGGNMLSLMPKKYLFLHFFIIGLMSPCRGRSHRVPSQSEKIHMPKMYRVLCGDRAIIVVIFFGPPGEKEVCDGSVAFLLELVYCFDLLRLLVDEYFLAPV